MNSNETLKHTRSGRVVKSTSNKDSEYSFMFFCLSTASPSMSLFLKAYLQAARSSLLLNLDSSSCLTLSVLPGLTYWCSLRRLQSDAISALESSSSSSNSIRSSARAASRTWLSCTSRAAWFTWFTFIVKTLQALSTVLRYPKFSTAGTSGLVPRKRATWPTLKSILSGR